MSKGRKKALRNFQSLLERELGGGYDWNGIDIDKLTELLRTGMLVHPTDLSPHVIKDLVLALRDCEDNDWCLALNLYGRSWKGHLHITLVAEENVWVILIIEDKLGRRIITWFISVDDLLSLREEDK